MAASGEEVLRGDVMEEEFKEYYALNRAGITGWFKTKEYALEKTLYILHRITGLGIVAFLLAHFYSVGWHPGYWGDVILGILVTFHVANGIRLILVELGWAVGKPLAVKKPSQRPISIIGPQKYLLMAVLLLFFITLLIWSFYALFVVTG